MLGCNLDGGQDVFAGGRDDDTDGIDLVVRGVGAVEQPVDRVEMHLARDPALQLVLQRRGGERERAVRFAPIALGMNGRRARLTGKRGGHFDMDLSRARWADETPPEWCNLAVDSAPECSIATEEDPVLRFHSEGEVLRRNRR